MPSLMRQPGFQEIIQVPDEQHFAHIDMGFIYLGPAPEVEPAIAAKPNPKKPKPGVKHDIR
jgi:hypothetical protein